VSERRCQDGTGSTMVLPNGTALKHSGGVCVSLSLSIADCPSGNYISKEEEQGQRVSEIRTHWTVCYVCVWLTEEGCLLRRCLQFIFHISHFRQAGLVIAHSAPLKQGFFQPRSTINPATRRWYGVLSVAVCRSNPMHAIVIVECWWAYRLSRWLLPQTRGS
jgi:hypothetical protein